MTAIASISTSHSGIASALTPTKVLAGGGPFVKCAPRCSSDHSPALRLVVDDICREFDDVFIARPGGSESDPDVPHRLRRLRAEVAAAHELAVGVRRDLISDVNGTTA